MARIRGLVLFALAAGLAVSSCSKDESPTQPVVDPTAPGAVTDLAAITPTTSSMALTWTAPGDDGGTGTAAEYDIRYFTEPITMGNWALATQATGEPTPHVAGTVETFTVAGLQPLTAYHFALQTRDEMPNWSALSNALATPPLPFHWNVTVSGRTVRWNTTVAMRGCVRYGITAGQNNHLAYPVAAADEDKAYRSVHAVPLLDPDAGPGVSVQLAGTTADGRFVVSPETTLTIGAAPGLPPPLLSFTTFDVQFGDAHLIRLPTAGHTVAIDGGNPYVNRNGETAPQHVMDWLDGHGITRLDVALATHMHSDHVGGLLRDGAGGPGLLDHYQIGLYLDVPAVTGNAYNQADVNAILTARGITKRVISPGLTSASNPDALDWDPSVEVMVLNAGAQSEWSGGDLNNDSVVLKISYGDVDFITGGDCLVVGESRILTNFSSALAGVEYFKASHHGRANANGLAYLQAIAPRVCVIPVAFIAYNEGPDQGATDTAQTLGRLFNLRTDVFRFDAAEPVGEEQDNQTFWHTTFTTDGVSYEVRIEPSVW